MDLDIVTLEITTLIIAFDHYDELVSDLLSANAGSNEEHEKIRQKSLAHTSGVFNAEELRGENKQLKSLSDIKMLVKTKLTGLDTKVIHELIEKMEKDTRKIKKIYKVSLKG